MLKSLPLPIDMTRTMMSGANALARSSMTPAERAAGRFMRAPDHDAGTGGDAAPAPDAGDSLANGGEGGGDAAPPADPSGYAPAGDQVTPSGDDADKGGESDKPAGDADKGDDDGSIAGKAGEKPAIEVLGAPEAYDVKAPEGMAFDKEAFEVVEPVLRKLNLSNEATQELVSAYAGEVIPLLQKRAEAGAEAAQLERAATIRKNWADEARGDPEIGGANFDQTVDACAQVWTKFGIKQGEGIRQLLDESGLGNHPDMLRFLSRVAKGTGEGQFVPSDGAGTDNRPIWDRVYGQPEAAKAG